MATTTMIQPRSLSGSQRSRQRLSETMPLGVTDNYQFWGDTTLIVEDAMGGSIRDVDGNRYDDFRLAYGPIILGYQDARVDGHVRSALNQGVLYGLSSQRTLSVAELIAGLVPNLDMVRFANTGSEAVMTVLRLARAFTKREHLIVIEGAFHGLFDWVMWRSDVEAWNPAKASSPKVEAFGAGIPQALREYIHFVPFNDAEAIRQEFKAHPSAISAVLIEPILGNSCAIAPEDGYLASIRKICDEFGALLIFDEVKTGFRVARGGAVELYGTIPDLWTFAKALGNGYPVAAFGGRHDIMDLIHPFPGGVMHGGTYTGHIVGLAAAEATLRIIKETPALETIAQTGRSLQQGMRAIFGRLGIPHHFTGHPAMFGVMFCETPLRSYRDWQKVNNQLYQKWANHLLDLGILIEPDSREPWFICEAHGQTEIGNVLDRVEAASQKALAS